MAAMAVATEVVGTDMGATVALLPSAVPLPAGADVDVRVLLEVEVEVIADCNMCAGSDDDVLV